MSRSKNNREWKPVTSWDFTRSVLRPNLSLLGLNLVVGLMMVVTMGLLLGAYGNHRLTVWLAYDALHGLERPLITGTNATPEMLMIAKDRIADLKAAQKELLDSNTVSFLFSILSLSLLTAGVYVLKRADTVLREGGAKKRDLIKHFESLQCAQLLTLWFTKLESSSSKGSGGPELEVCLSEALELLNHVKQWHLGIEPKTLVWIRDSADATGQCLPSQNRAENINRKLRALLNILKDQRLTEDYDRRLKRLDRTYEAALI